MEQRGDERWGRWVALAVAVAIVEDAAMVAVVTVMAAAMALPTFRTS